jgi:hypothetical protein
MDKKIGFFRTILICTVEVLTTINNTLGRISQHNLQVEMEGSLGISKEDEEIVDQAVDSTTPDAVKVDMLLNEVMSGKPYKGNAIERSQDQESARLTANECMLSSKAFVLLAVQEKGNVQIILDLAVASAVDQSALLVLADQAADIVQGNLYGEGPEDSDEEDGI